MNKSLRELPEFVEKFRAALADIPATVGSQYETALAPPSTHLTTLAALLHGTKIKLAAQNCGIAKSGAYTGEISPVVLKEIGCPLTLVGHSERRHVFNEDDVLIASRMKAALEEGGDVLLCVGELLPDRKAGKTFKVVESQLSILKQNVPVGAFARLSVAYEPVWAIGTGETATPEQAQEVHAFIRNWFSENGWRQEAGKLRILYGGSVKPENSAQIMAKPDVDGLLVGGASLDPAVFASVIKNGLKPRT